MTHYYKNHYKNPKTRASAFALQRKGSITLEASVVVSLFFLAMICLIYLFQIMSLRVTIRNGLQAVGKELAVEAYTNPMFSASEVEKKLVKHIGEDRLEESVIVGGADGIDCTKSKEHVGTTIMDLTATYQIEIPIAIFRIPVIQRTESVRIKGWTGYEGDGNSSSKEEVVYVTAQGIVYHKNRDCTYLETSVTASNIDEIKNLRNQSGEIYRACRYCDVGEDGRIYVSAYGNRYHGTLKCSRIKRHVYEVPLKDIYGIGGCSKCVE